MSDAGMGKGTLKPPDNPERNLDLMLRQAVHMYPRPLLFASPAGRVLYLNEAARSLVLCDTGSPSPEIAKLELETTEFSRVSPCRCRIGGLTVEAVALPVTAEGKLIGYVLELSPCDRPGVVCVRDSGAQGEGKKGSRAFRCAWTASYSFDDIKGVSNPLERAKREARRAAATDYSVLLHGESGVGKELFAHAIHRASARWAGPFVQVNCAAIPSELLESELFGYAEGAFTGARKGGKPGKVEIAAGGTLFLDEIADLPLPMQAKLLRVLDNREVQRVGSTENFRVDIRVIAATNRDLQGMMRSGKFRADLYYRLSTIPIGIPPLRERLDDIVPIAQAWISQHRADLPPWADKVTFSPEAIQLLKAYSWPGNVRELINVLKRTLLMADGPYIRAEDLPDDLRGAASLVPGPAEQSHTSPLGDAVAQAEIRAIVGALRYAKGNKVQAAKILGIHRSTLYEKLRRLELTDDSES